MGAEIFGTAQSGQHLLGGICTTAGTFPASLQEINHIIGLALFHCISCMEQCIQHGSVIGLCPAAPGDGFCTVPEETADAVSVQLVQKCSILSHKGVVSSDEHGAENNAGGTAHGFYQSHAGGSGQFMKVGECNAAAQHGFIRNTPAEHCGARTYWIGDDYYLELTGTMRESSLFGTNLVLRRTITTKLGDPAVEIRDEIENESSTENVPCMLMYHCNAGFPLMDACSVFEIDPVESGDRDEIAANGRKEESYKVFGDPIVGYDEQVFYHKLPADENGWCHATMVNPERKLSLTVSYHNQELPYLIHWKCKDAGNYVTGIEPSNCHPEGVHKEEEYGTLRKLSAHETITTGITIRAGER